VGVAATLSSCTARGSCCLHTPAATACEQSVRLTVGAGPKKGPPKPYSTPDGILKAEWFLKQRQRRAAVALVLIQR